MDGCMHKTLPAAQQPPLPAAAPATGRQQWHQRQDQHAPTQLESAGPAGGRYGGKARAASRHSKQAHSASAISVRSPLLRQQKRRIASLACVWCAERLLWLWAWCMAAASTCACARRAAGGWPLGSSAPCACKRCRSRSGPPSLDALVPHCRSMPLKVVGFRCLIQVKQGVCRSMLMGIHTGCWMQPLVAAADLELAQVATLELCVGVGWGAGGFCCVALSGVMQELLVPSYAWCCTLWRAVAVRVGLHCVMWA